ncbi:peptidylprolyl isomerase [Hyphococcus flavus]|uniref:peptidylprolyl isomerase n=1 Tax=Hyphococcus flavus TaxID=1866326 RepID=A0AAE9ZIY7_9PROT|nr:peptidylprolyl isomerase [Hyphococcus flavus]WDI31260.1 peptidylprolyl isomerase [Hyphococcus flavus]
MRRLAIMAAASLAALGVTAAFADDDDEPAKPTPLEFLQSAPDDVWRPLDPENTLYMDLPAGLVVIELRPDFAPNHIQRIKELTREGFYDGLTFHRVIEGFMAQGGDPKGDGTGGSDKPDLEAEFSREASEVSGFTQIGRDRIAPRVGYVDGMPAAAQPEGLRSFLTTNSVKLWPLHCPGVMSMARATDPNSANSQFFLMIGDSRLNLDKRYTGWGWIVDGFEATRRIVRGEPPSRPTPIIRVRLEADIPASQRENIRVLNTSSETFKQYLQLTEDVSEDSYVKDICEIRVPIKKDGKIER